MVALALDLDMPKGFWHLWAQFAILCLDPCLPAVDSAPIPKLNGSLLLSNLTSPLDQTRAPARWAERDKSLFTSYKVLNSWIFPAGLSQDFYLFYLIPLMVRHSG